MSLLLGWQTRDLSWMTLTWCWLGTTLLLKYVLLLKQFGTTINIKYVTWSDKSINQQCTGVLTPCKIKVVWFSNFSRTELFDSLAQWANCMFTLFWVRSKILFSLGVLTYHTLTQEPTELWFLCTIRHTPKTYLKMTDKSLILGRPTGLDIKDKGIHKCFPGISIKWIWLWTMVQLRLSFS